MRTEYYTYHPQNFSNAYTAIKVTTPEESKALDTFWDNMNMYFGCRLVRRSAKEIREMASDERWRRKHDEAFSGYCNLEPITVTEFLREGEWQ